MRFCLVLCLIFAFTLTSAAKSITWGKRTAKDRLLYRENVVRFPRAGSVQEVYVSFPRLGSSGANSANVSAIFVYDRFRNSSGAIPLRLVPLKKATNPRFNSTIIILQSKHSQGINSTVEFYGKQFYGKQF